MTANGTPSTRLRRTGAIVALGAAGALALGACSGSDTPDDRLGSGPVSGRTGSVTATGTGTGTSSGTPGTSGSTRPTTGSFADRAGIPDRRYVDAGTEMSIPDQSGDGTSVRVDELRVTRGPSHVAIFTAAGQLLGSAPVSPGASPSTVRLDTPVPASGELQAVLFHDDGDGRFDLTKDTAVNDGDTDPDDRLDLDDEDFDYVVR